MAAATLIVGNKTPAWVDENARSACQFAVFADERLWELESRTLPNVEDFDYYKMPAPTY